MKDSKILKGLQSQLTKLEADLLVCRSVLRYIERVEKKNLDYIKNVILTDSLREAIKTLGDGKYPIKDIPGFFLCVQNNIITTIFNIE